MKKSELFSKIEDKIALCKKEYEAGADDAFISNVQISKQKMLEKLLDRLKNGEQEKILLAYLKKRLPELEKEMEREEEAPSFDWYDEHYHYKVLYGQCAAYREIIGVLEEALQE